MLNFVVPVRHQATTRDWALVSSNLRATIRSIAAQSIPLWRAWIIADRAADLSNLDETDNIKVLRTDFPPAHIHNGVGRDTVYNIIRDDKGARVAEAYAKLANEDGYMMVTDYDDFVSRRLASFVQHKDGCPGWYINQGLLYTGGIFLRKVNYLDEICGTSLILNLQVLRDIQSTCSASDFIRFTLGSHKFTKHRLEGTSNQLAPLPFTGAVYRVEHENSTETRSSTWEELANIRSLIRRPRHTMRALANVRALLPTHSAEFFGGGSRP